MAITKVTMAGTNNTISSSIRHNLNSTGGQVTIMEVKAMERLSHMELQELPVSQVVQQEAGEDKAAVGVALGSSSGALHTISSSGVLAMALEARAARGGRGVVSGTNFPWQLLGS